MMLKDKVAVIYGTGGDVGGAVARAFAREGARLFLTGRHIRKGEAVAADIVGDGGIAEELMPWTRREWKWLRLSRVDTTGVDNLVVRVRRFSLSRCARLARSSASSRPP